MPDQIEKRLLTATEAAAYLGISLYTLKKIETMGCLRPSRTQGGHRRYTQQILDKYLEGNTCSPGRVHHRSEGVMAPTGAREKRRSVALVDRTQVERAEEALRQSEAQVRKRLEEQTFLREAMAVISSTLELPSVLTRIAEQMCIAIGSTSAYIMSFDPETNTSTVMAEYSGPEACPKEQVSDLGETYDDTDAEFLKALQANQPHIEHVDDPDLPERDRAVMLRYGAESILYVPLWIREQLIGYAEQYESRRRREFTPEEIALCQAIAQNAAIAIENARLYDEAKSERDKLAVIMAGMEDGLDVVGQDHIVKFQNRVLFERFGDLTGQLCYEGYMGLVEPCESCPMVKAIETGEHHRAESRRLDGRYYEITSMPLRNPDGSVDALEIVRDITDRKMAEEEIRHRTRQLNLVNEVGQRVAPILSFPELYQAVVKAVHEAFGYQAVAIFSVQGDEVVLEALDGPGRQVMSSPYSQKMGEGMVGWVAETGEELLANDVTKEPRFVRLDFLEIASEADVPIKLGGATIGVLAAGSDRPHSFSDTDVTALHTIADQVARAIENARLYDEAQQRIGELSGLHEISQAFGSLTDVRETYGTLTKRMAELIGCQQCFIATYDEEAREMQAQPPGYGVPDELVRSYRYKVDAPSGRDFWNFRLQGPLLVNDMAEMPDFFSQWTEGFRHFNVLIIPMIVEGRLTGLVIAANKSGGFADDDSKLLTIFANQAAVVIENARLFEETKRLAATDPLTGVWNRRHIESRFRTEMERARRFGHALSVLVMDIDKLKLFNDTYGHPAGDEVIRTVAQVVLTSCRQIDIVGRYGGDEFAVILPETGARGAGTVAERILANLEKEPFEAPRGSKVPMSISIGAACYPADTDDPDRLFSLADAAMYRVKLAGGGQFASLTVDPERGPVASVAAFDVLQGLLITVDAKDHYTFKHSREVTQHALALARHMGLSEEEISALEVAGSLHDVGKIGIPTDVLRKPGRLTPEEYKVVQEHPRLGHTLLRQLPQMETVLQAVLHHHERYDGTGYPDALKGEEIPLLARILAVADAFAAMVTDRPYRKALTLEEVLDEVRCEAGKQFDPELAERFVELVEKGEIQ